jgi:Tfp pilus assembly PilM family ATPase
MALVALQFDDNQILVAGARANAKRLQVQNLFTVPLTGDDAVAIESLKSKLSEHGLTRSDAILIVSRADTEMRELVVPPAPDNEVPDMVRFIARNEFASLNDSWGFDYLPLSGGTNQQRTVLAIGISPELRKQQENIATEAGLKIKHIVMRPFASINLIQSRLTEDVCRLVVDPNGDQTEMTIVDGDSILATRTVRIPLSNEADKRAASLISEVRRTLASSRKTMGDKKVIEVLMFGDEKSNKSLKGDLNSHLDLKVEFLDPVTFASIGSGANIATDSNRYAGLLGSMVQHISNQDHAVDFANPRKPVVLKKDYSRWYLWGGLALAASLLTIIFAWWSLSTQAKTIAKLNSELQRLKTQNAGVDDDPGVDQVLAEISTIDNWKSADVNWLEELSEFSERALTPDDAIVDSLDAVAGLKSGSNARMMLTTRINNLGNEKLLNDSLNDRPYLVRPTRWTDSGDESYPLTSSLTVELANQKADFLKSMDEKAKAFIQEKLKKSQEASRTSEENSPTTDLSTD